jgi:hypothetical protein
MKATHEEIERVKNATIPCQTWQSVSAISYHARVAKKRTLMIVKYMRDTLGLVEMRDCRLDGHNPVWLVRPLERDKKNKIDNQVRECEQKTMPLIVEV